MASENPFHESTKTNPPGSPFAGGSYLASVKQKPRPAVSANPLADDSFPAKGLASGKEEALAAAAEAKAAKVDLSAGVNTAARADKKDPEAEPARATAPWDSILMSLPQAVVVLDEQQRVLFTNLAHAELLGFDASETEDGMTGWLRTASPEPERRAKIISSWHEHIWRNQLTRTYPLSSASKGIRHIEFRSSLSPEGHMLVLQTDVTDNIASDEALRLANLKFRMLFDKAPGGIAVVNQEGLIVEVNPAFLEFGGVTAESLIGKPFVEILNREDAGRLRSLETREFSDGAEPPLKLRFVFPQDQRERPALVTPAYLANELNEAVFKIYMLKPRDVQAINKLKDLSLKAQSLLDAIPDMFVLVDRDGFITDWSPPSSPWTPESPLNRDSIGKPARIIWPPFGAMLESTLGGVFDGGLTLRQEFSDQATGLSFTVTLAPFGPDTALALIEKPQATEPPCPATEALPAMAMDPKAARPWLADWFAGHPSAVLVAKFDGSIVDANPAACALFGKPESELTQSNIFRLLSKIPGSEVSFEPTDLVALPGPETWNGLIALSSAGPLETSVTIDPSPSKDPEGNHPFFMVSIEPAETVRTKAHSPSKEDASDVYELAQSQFRCHLQVIASLFSISSQAQDASSFRPWLSRLKVLAECMTSRRQVGIVHLLRAIADQMSSVMGRGLGLREVVISGPSSLTIDNETAVPFGLLAGELIYLALSNSHGPGPSLYMDLEASGRQVILTGKPSEHCCLFTEANIDHAKVIEILVEQIRGRISVSNDERAEDGLSPSIRIAFPVH